MRLVRKCLRLLLLSVRFRLLFLPSAPLFSLTRLQFWHFPQPFLTLPLLMLILLRRSWQTPRLALRFQPRSLRLARKCSQPALRSWHFPHLLLLPALRSWQIRCPFSAAPCLRRMHLIFQRSPVRRPSSYIKPLLLLSLGKFLA